MREDYDFCEAAQFDRPGYPKLHFIEHRYASDPTNWWVPNARLRRGDAAQRRLRDPRPPGGGGLSLPARGARRPTVPAPSIPRKEDRARDSKR